MPATVIATIEIELLRDEIADAGSVAQAVQNLIGCSGAVVVDAEILDA